VGINITKGQKDKRQKTNHSIGILTFSLFVFLKVSVYYNIKMPIKDLSFCLLSFVFLKEMVFIQSDSAVISCANT